MKWRCKQMKPLITLLHLWPRLGYWATNTENNARVQFSSEISKSPLTRHISSHCVPSTCSIRLISLLCWSDSSPLQHQSPPRHPLYLSGSPWGGFNSTPIPPNNTLPIMPLFNPIPPVIDTRGLERLRSVCLCVSVEQLSWVSWWKAAPAWSALCR